MTRYERGFMRKCAEHGVDGRALLERLRGMRKKAQAKGQAVTEPPYTPPPEEDNPWRKDSRRTAIFNAADRLGVGLHTPVTPKNVSWAIGAPSWRDEIDEHGMFRSPNARDMAFEAAMQAYLAKNKDVRPSERMPTPFELQMYQDALKERIGTEGDYSDSGWGSLQDQEGLEGGLGAAFMMPEHPLSDEVLRRVWATATNDVPIAVTSPTPAK